MHGRCIHLGDEETVQPYGNRGEALFCATRRDVHCTLLDHAERVSGVSLRFERRCLGVDLDAVTVELEEPSGAVSTVTGARLVGADGVNSVVRAAFARHSWFAGGRTSLPRGYRELVVAPELEATWMSNRNLLHVWPRRDSFLLAFPNRDGTFTLSLHARVHAPPGGPSTAGSDGADLLGRALPRSRARGELHGAREDTRANPIVTVVCRPWVYRDRAALLGDAAHAVAPYLGQGLSASIEDCFELDALLDEHDDHWGAALTEFSRKREPEVGLFGRLSQAHFDELGRGVADDATLLRRRVEQALNAADPTAFATLHHLVCFTTLPYSRAVAANRAQSVIVDELLAEIGPADISDDELRTLAAAKAAAAFGRTDQIRNEVIGATA